MRDLRTFIIEDSPVILENLVETLQELVPVSILGSAADEPSATQWLRQHGNGCDLVIIDIFLKRGSGLQVLEGIQGQFPTCRRVVMSNYATPEIRRKSEQLGADAIFDKSDELDQMLSYCAQLQKTLSQVKGEGQG